MISIASSPFLKGSFEPRLWLLLIGLGLPSQTVPSAQASPPDHDSFARAQLISGLSGAVSGSNRDATAEFLEPPHSLTGSGKSVWYVWHCSSAGKMVLSLDPISFAHAIRVYRGRTVDKLIPDAGTENIRVEVLLIPGQVYHIAIDGRLGESGDFVLRWRQSFNPGGGPDLVVVESLFKSKLVDRNYSGSECEVQEGCGTPGLHRQLRFDLHVANVGREDLVLGAPGESPLFQYAPCHNHFHFDAFATFRLLDRGGGLVRVGGKVGFCLEDVLPVSASSSDSRRFDCDDQGIQAGWSDVYSADLPCQGIDVTGLDAGSYFLEIELDPQHQIPESNTENNIARFPIRLEAPCSMRPPNDDVKAAAELSSDILTRVDESRCATAEVGEPRHSSSSAGAGKSLWYRWVPRESGAARITTEGSDFDTVLAVYDGEALDPLKTHRLAENDDISDSIRQSSVALPVVAGRPYWIAVDGVNTRVSNESGRVVLSLNPGRNDAFVFSQPILGSSGAVSGSSLTATRESGEPRHGGSLGQGSLWYYWTAEVDGLITFDTLGSCCDTLLGVYRGETLEALVTVAADDDSAGYGFSRTSFIASAGTKYFIAVDTKADGWPGDGSGVLRLSWSDAHSTSPPVIQIQPRSIAGFVSKPARLSVSASGATPLGYQWFHGTDPVRDNLFVRGADSAELTFGSLRTGDRGFYHVAISNRFGVELSEGVSVIAATRSRSCHWIQRPDPSSSRVHLSLLLLAEGGEHGGRFQLTFDPSQVTRAEFAIADGLPATTSLETVLDRFSEGVVQLEWKLPPNEVFSAGEVEIAEVFFEIAPAVPDSAAMSVCFDSGPGLSYVYNLDGVRSLIQTLSCATFRRSIKDELDAFLSANGAVVVRLKGFVGRIYEIQVSADLSRWAPLALQLNSTGELLLRDDTTSSGQRRFYRAIRHE